MAQAAALGEASTTCHTPLLSTLLPSSGATGHTQACTARRTCCPENRVSTARRNRRTDRTGASTAPPVTVTASLYAWYPRPVCFSFPHTADRQPRREHESRSPREYLRPCRPRRHAQAVDLPRRQSLHDPFHVDLSARSRCHRRRHCRPPPQAWPGWELATAMAEVVGGHVTQHSEGESGPVFCSSRMTGLLRD